MTTLTTSLDIAKQALAILGHDQSTEIAAIDANLTREDRMANLFYESCRDELLELAPWNHAVEHRALVLTAGYDAHNQIYNYDPIEITNITTANPAVVTAPAHGYVTGDMVKIYDVSYMTEVNSDIPYHVTKLTADTFSLTGIDSTNWTASPSSGKCVKEQPRTIYTEGYTYDLPSTYGYAIRLDSGEDFEIKDSKLITLDANAILIYIRNDITDVSKFRSLFINCLIYRLAIKMAPSIIGVKAESRNFRETLKSEYNIAMNEARLMLAYEKQETRNTKSGWLASAGFTQ